MPTSQLTEEQRLQNVENKLDQIIKLLNASQLNTNFEEKTKESIKHYMMQNYNITWLNDQIEENVYDVLIETIFSIIKNIA